MSLRGPLLALALATAAWGHFWGPAYSNLGGANDPKMALEICGIPKAGHTLVLACHGCPPGSVSYLLLGVSAGNIPVHGGLLVPVPLTCCMLPALGNKEGTALWVLPLSSTPPTFYGQVARRLGKTTYLSNAVSCLPVLAP